MGYDEVSRIRGMGEGVWKRYRMLREGR